MGATVRRSSGDGGPIIINRTVAAEVMKVLARHNPGASKSALTAAKAVITIVSEVASKLSEKKRHSIVSRERELTRVVEAVIAGLEIETPTELAPVQIVKPVEVSKGEGVPALIDVGEGRRRLDAIAVGARLEDWAGPVGGPREIEEKFGTKRSTLHDWQKRGAVIGLLKGERKHVFPLAQFVDGRPIEGMAEITRIIKNPRAAWQWLILPKPSIGGAPIDSLKKGQVDEVVAAAQRDFGAL